MKRAQRRIQRKLKIAKRNRQFRFLDSKKDEGRAETAPHKYHNHEPDYTGIRFILKDKIAGRDLQNQVEATNYRFTRFTRRDICH